MTLIPTASQTVGPFFNFGLTTDPKLGVLVCDGAHGERIRLSFRVLDGDGAPTPGDSMIEIWQADANGMCAHPEDPRCATADPNFCNFGRLETRADGTCAFETVKPGRVPAANGTPQAPHISVIVFARGISRHLHTRVYFAGEAANTDDPVLALVPETRRNTLLAHPVPGEPGRWHFDVRLQGGSETVFFDV